MQTLIGRVLTRVGSGWTEGATAEALPGNFKFIVAHRIEGGALLALFPLARTQMEMLRDLVQAGHLEREEAVIGGGMVGRKPGPMQSNVIWGSPGLMTAYGRDRPASPLDGTLLGEIAGKLAELNVI